jgi:hypothetical protein
MPKFLVVSYDNDEQQTFHDWMLADDENQAKGRVGDIRQYAVPVAAYTAGELIDIAALLEAATEEQIKDGIEQVVSDSGLVEDDETIEGWHKGPHGLWYGSKPDDYEPTNYFGPDGKVSETI